VLDGPIFHPDSDTQLSIKPSHDVPQFGFNLRLMGHLFADPFNRLIQNTSQQFGILSQRHRRPDALQHLFEELRGLLAFRVCSFGLLP